MDGGTNPAMGAVVITANVHVRADAWKIHAARDMQVWHHPVPCFLSYYHPRLHFPMRHSNQTNHD